jgi:hypothetical protein
MTVLGLVDGDNRHVAESAREWRSCRPTRVPLNGGLRNFELTLRQLVPVQTAIIRSLHWPTRPV